MYGCRSVKFGCHIVKYACRQHILFEYILKIRFQASPNYRFVLPMVMAHSFSGSVAILVDFQFYGWHCFHIIVRHTGWDKKIGHYIWSLISSAYAFKTPEPISVIFDILRCRFILNPSYKVVPPLVKFNNLDVAVNNCLMEVKQNLSRRVSYKKKTAEWNWLH